MNVLKPHVSLIVFNMEASVAIYTQAFDATATQLNTSYEKYVLQSP